MDRIHLMHVISDTNIGGAGHHLLTYLRHYDRRRFNVEVVLPQGSLLYANVRALDVTVHTVDGIADTSSSVSGIRAFMRLFAQHRPHLLHTHGCLSARVAARIKRVPVLVYTRHSVFEPSRRQTTGAGLLFNTFVGNTFADGVIAVAEAAKRNLTQTGIRPDKIVVIYNGVDKLNRVSDDRLEAMRATLRAGDKPVITIMARLEAIKGHRYFLEAAAKLKQRGIDAVYAIAGTGRESDNIAAYAKQFGISDDVRLLGFVKDTNALLCLTRVQVNASYGTEASSLSLLEGMSLGIPAVVSDYGGNPEVISDGVNGVVVPQHDADSMAAQLERLLIDADYYKALGDGAARTFDASFSAQHMTDAMESYYLKLCKKNA